MDGFALQLASQAPALNERTGFLARGRDGPFYDRNQTAAGGIMSIFMSEASKQLINEFASGKQELRSEAIAIHRESIRLHGLRRGDPYFNFMSEVDNSCPDLLLRSRYRQTLLGERFKLFGDRVNGRKS